MTKRYALLYNRALQAGLTAGKEATPTPMRLKGFEFISEGINDFDDPTFEGICGFATVNVPGNTSFGRWLKKAGLGDKSHRGGLDIWVHQFGQSEVVVYISLLVLENYERKVAFANAMAEVLREGGVNAHARGNVD